MKRFEPAGGPALTYDDFGDPATSPIVLLPGGGGDRNQWVEIVGRLAAKCRVLALDPRGHGGSDRTPGEYRIEHYAADLEAFIERVPRRPVALVGHSPGGIIAAQVAGTRPDLVTKAFFEDVPLHNDTRVWAAGEPFFGPLTEMLRDVHRRGGTVEDVVAGLRRIPSPASERGTPTPRSETVERILAAGFLACDPGIFIGHDEQLRAYDPAHAMTCPVHVLRADPDVGPPPFGAAFRPEHEKPFLAVHPCATVEFVKGAWHGIHFWRPDLFTDKLEAFLDKE